MQIFGFQDYRSCILPAQNGMDYPIWFALRKIYDAHLFNKEHNPTEHSLRPTIAFHFI